MVTPIVEWAKLEVRAETHGPLSQTRGGHVASRTSSSSSGSRLSESRCSITDLTLEQALIRIKEIEDENRAHRDNLRQHNAMMRGHYEDLALWRKREQEKTEQFKALITALREENQEKQVQIMALKDKEKETSSQLTSLTEERSHLLRQRAISDQRVFNLIKQAEEQGVKGLVPGNDDDACGESNIVFVSTSEKEAEIAKLEAAVENKEDTIAQLRANLLQREHEVETLRGTTQQLLKDMQNQQQFKDSIQEENRSLTQRLMHAEKQMNQHMQSMMENKRREMQTPLQGGVDNKLPNLLTEKGSPQAEGATPIVVSYPDNPEEIMNTLQSLNAEKQNEKVKNDLQKEVEEGQRARDALEKEITSLIGQVKGLQLEVDREKQRSSELQDQANKDLDDLTRQYEDQLRQVIQQSKEHDNQQSIQAATTGDVSILRSQVLSLIKEVDEANTKNSALTATCHLKDDKIRELEEAKGSLVNEHGSMLEENTRLIQALHNRYRQLEQTQQENYYIKAERQKLQDSFSQLVTDYKEVQEMLETQRNEAEEEATKFRNYRQQAEEKLAKKAAPRQMMEEINRLTAQVIAAEEAIKGKDDELERLKAMEEVLRIQADQYQCDFNDERESRTKLAQELGKVVEQNRQLMEENSLINMQKLQGMQARHSAVPNPQLGAWPYPQGPANSHTMMPPTSATGLAPTPGATTLPAYPLQPSRPFTPMQHEAVGGTGLRPAAAALLGATGGRRAEGEDLASLRQYECPKCTAMFPDEDTVQLHVTECLEKD
ncbi:NF-kappa-B essential modulator [Elysia marginata]|uniref:NF-kappa-B essential modulator n=1 Tax=Elysia marginata TaxID=1093978 RepID=A0AAV4GWC8_9GAST|nr:NF-kappa-B essential modulator [Elysia marginata]